MAHEGTTGSGCRVPRASARRIFPASRTVRSLLSSSGIMSLRGLLLRARYVALLLPAFALFSSIEAGCAAASTDTNTNKDDFASEDQAPAGAGYGYGYGD